MGSIFPEPPNVLTAAMVLAFWGGLFVMAVWAVIDMLKGK